MGTACSIGVLCGITIFVVACLRPKRMYVFASYIIYTPVPPLTGMTFFFLYRLAFPTVLIIYMIIALLVLGEGTKQHVYHVGDDGMQQY